MPTDNLNKILEAIGELRGLVASFIREQAGQNDRMNRIDEDIEDLRDHVDTKIVKIDERLQKVEKKQWGLFLVITVVWTGIQALLHWLK